MKMVLPTLSQYTFFLRLLPILSLVCCSSECVESDGANFDLQFCHHTHFNLKVNVMNRVS